MRETILLIILGIASPLAMLAAGIIYSITVILISSRFSAHRVVYIFIGIIFIIFSFIIYSIIERLVLLKTNIRKKSFITITIVVPAVLFIFWLIASPFFGFTGGLLASCGVVICFSLMLAICLRYLLLKNIYGKIQ